MIQLTQPQINAYLALDLPFDLDDTAIARYFNEDGAERPTEACTSQQLHDRATQLSQAALRTVDLDPGEVSAFRAAQRDDAASARAASIAAHRAQNAQRAAEAAARRAERQVQHRTENFRRHIVAGLGREARVRQHIAANDARRAAAKVA